jgi:hypothetical protein
MATAEIRGRGRTWKVLVPDPGQMAHSVPVYDENGVLKDTLWVGAVALGDSPKLIEAYGGPFTTIEEATEYARYLGFAEVRINKTMTREEALAKARKAR